VENYDSEAEILVKKLEYPAQGCSRSCAPTQQMYREGAGDRDRYYERDRGGPRDNGRDRRRESDGGGGYQGRGDRGGERDIDRKRPRNSYDSYDSRGGGGRGGMFIVAFVCIVMVLNQCIFRSPKRRI
jgi:hypothetical protein